MAGSVASTAIRQLPDRYYSCSDSFNCRAGAHPHSVCALSSDRLELPSRQKKKGGDHPCHRLSVSAL